MLLNLSELWLSCLDYLATSELGQNFTYFLIFSFIWIMVVNLFRRRFS